MTVRVGINGFGRMGRLILRAAWGNSDIEFVQINDPAGDAATLAHLLTFDSVHGRWAYDAVNEGKEMVIDGRRIACTTNASIADTDWSGCDVVIEASGKFKKQAVLQALLYAGCKASGGDGSGERRRRAVCCTSDHWRRKHRGT